jgi:uncharacterized protein YecT (DUF1311 family)
MPYTSRALLILLVTVSLPVLANDDSYSATYTACMDASGGVTVNMLDCNAAETELQDARLNTGFKAASKALSATNKANLLAAQRLWLKYRDANCMLYGSLTGGSMDGLNGTGCFLDMTKARADDLAWLAQQ